MLCSGRRCCWMRTVKMCCCPACQRLKLGFLEMGLPDNAAVAGFERWAATFDPTMIEESGPLIVPDQKHAAGRRSTLLPVYTAAIGWEEDSVDLPGLLKAI
ncbi:hypothetical protein ACLOJK_005327 [Asimina triloba]